MPHTICIVHVDTGLVDERSSDTLSADLPQDIADEPTRASIDRSGHLHYVGADGRARVCEAMTRRLADRDGADAFLLPAHAREGDRHSAVPLNVCVLEPAGLQQSR